MLKLKTDSITDSATEFFNDIFSKDVKFNKKQTRQSLKLKIDSVIISLIYSKGLKFY